MRCDNQQIRMVAGFWLPDLLVFTQ